MRHRFAVTNWLTAAYRTVQLVGRQAVHLGGALAAQGLDRRGGRDRHQRHLQPRPGHGRLRAVLRRDRLVPAGRGHPAQHVGAARPARPDRRARPDAADRPAAAPARPAAARTSATSWASSPTPPATSSAGSGCCAASAASRSSTTATGASRRPPDRPASRSLGCSRCSTRSRCSCPASSWSSWSGSGARYAVQGRISPGELVAFYGYSAFLMIPLRTATEYANKLIRARVSAAPGLPGAGAHARPPRPGGPGRAAAARAPSWPTPAPGSGSGPG